MIEAYRTGNIRHLSGFVYLFLVVFVLSLRYLRNDLQNLQNIFIYFEINTRFMHKFSSGGSKITLIEASYTTVFRISTKMGLNMSIDMLPGNLSHIYASQFLTYFVWLLSDSNHPSQ